MPDQAYVPISTPNVSSSKLSVLEERVCQAEERARQARTDETVAKARSSLLLSELRAMQLRRDSQE
jgi:hypothetical protein